MKMSEFFQRFEILAKSKNMTTENFVSIQSEDQLRSFKEFCGPVFVFEIGAQDAFVSVESISKRALEKAIQFYQPGVK